VGNLWGSDFLYLNERDGTFTRVTGVEIVTLFKHVVGLASADFDNDGFLDLFGACMDFDNDVTPETDLLYRNNGYDNGNRNGWLLVRLVGTHSNRSAIGAKVRAKATVWGNQVWQLRQISGGRGCNQDDLRVHFGLGDAEIIDTIRIEWPGPAFTIQELHNVPVNQILTITEPLPGPMLAATWTDRLQLTLEGELGAAYRLETSSDLQTWLPLTTLTITEPSGAVAFTDDESQQVAQRFYRVVRQDD
jgi:hypothetical protein